MRSMKPDRDICVRKIKIPSEGRNIPALVLSPKKKTDKAPGILWYLRNTDKTKVPIYAAPARCTDFSGLPPAYTFVGDGEPFFAEAVRYIHKLKKNNIHAELDIYHSNIHAFDMMYPELEISRQAAEKFNRQFAYTR